MAAKFLFARRMAMMLLPSALAATGASCSSGVEDHLPSEEPGGVNLPLPQATPSGTPASKCDTPAEGCPCDTPGDTTSCRGPAVHDGSYVYCTTGFRVCTAGVWGACVLPKVY